LYTSVGQKISKAKKFPPLRNVIKRMMIIVFLALLNKALGTMGWGA
jgi:hypothetical protein